jgi:hypothetical protein
VLHAAGGAHEGPAAAGGRAATRTGLPPLQVMLHSYGGSPDMVAAFTKLPGGLGQRFYFGFSHVINGTKGRGKLLDRIRCRSRASRPALMLPRHRHRTAAAGCPRPQVQGRPGAQAVAAPRSCAQLWPMHAAQGRPRRQAAA